MKNVQVVAVCTAARVEQKMEAGRVDECHLRHVEEGGDSLVASRLELMPERGRTAHVELAHRSNQTRILQRLDGDAE
jgi:hypothetical protein